MFNFFQYLFLERRSREVGLLVTVISFFSLVYINGLQIVVPRSAASASPENLQVIPIPGAHSRPAELETL